MEQNKENTEEIKKNPASAWHAQPDNDEMCIRDSGMCVANCPGLAITIIDKTYSDTEAVIEFPFEYLPLPEVGDTVQAVSRAGEVVCDATVTSVRKIKAYAGTAVVGIAVPKQFADEVRSMKRLKRA